MKFRIGFVSNSSSSSFICDLCHNYGEISSSGLNYTPGKFESKNGCFMSCEYHRSIKI